MRGLFQILLLLLCAASGYVHATDDAIAAAEALLRHDAATDHTYLHDNGAHFRYFVAAGGVDLPAEALSRLRDTGLMFLPGSSWKQPEQGTHVGRDMQVTIGEPKLLPDGTFEINYNFYCGPLCASTNSAILRHDASGWHVVATRLKAIS